MNCPPPHPRLYSKFYRLILSKEMLTGLCNSLNSVCTVLFLTVAVIMVMLSGSHVTTAWRVLRLLLQETPSRYGG
jgi:hypothetical protein